MLYNAYSRTMEEDDDDVPSLSAETFSALQDFYREQEQREEQVQEHQPNGVVEKSVDSIASFEEDWQLSQFWYDDATAEALAKECSKLVRSGCKIACVSCPTLYVAIKKNLQEDDVKESVSSAVKLFEYDRRFSRFGEDFILYDYKSPLDVPRELRQEFDLVVADPPFLSEECLTKTAVTVKYLAKDKIILCTGAVMEELLGRLLDLKICKFVPHHRQNLANEFRCFANYDLDSGLESS